MKLLVIIFLLSLLRDQFYALSFEIDLETVSASNISYFNISCERQIEIDFSFSDDQIVCGSECKIQNPQGNILNIYKRIEDNYLSLKLQSFEFTNQSFVKNRASAQNWRSFTFKFIDDNNIFYVIIPIIFSSLKNQSVIHLSQMNTENQQFQQFSELKSLKSVNQPFSSSIFRFLNLRDFGLFYRVEDPGKNITILLSILVYSPIYNFSSQAFASKIPTLQLNYPTAGKSCFGSQATQAIFTTHLSDNYPLWTGWFVFLFFWAFHLISKKNTQTCYDRRFQNNKWTSWSLYSLFYIGNNQFFSKLSRATNLLIGISWQALVISIVQSNIQSTNYMIILYSFLIAIITVQPISYLIGWAFLKRSYHEIMERSRIYTKIKHLELYSQDMDYKNKHECQIQIFDQEERVYTVLYFYYVLGIIFPMLCWALSVHLMQITYKGNNHLQWKWVITFITTIIVDIIIVEFILTCFFGNKQYFQMRGYYYEFTLGEQQQKKKWSL